MTYIPWTSEYTLKLMTIRWRNVIPWILIPCDKKSDLKIYVCQCDLYFMVQSLCLIPQRLFDYALYLNDYLMEKCHTLDISFM